ncbi:hypothetical protein POM88_001823 [Heracleum sosnowskyi]|uniref:PPM-type phosphatase domain-containing protein n=1 Tax=Heracleum sosnowskyi TaxID=360622 RepID=A0AAD8JEA8_9APIA|nr:hypothetical protein POM88_001823 [Heracleum sosnowskyi]
MSSTSYAKQEDLDLVPLIQPLFSIKDVVSVEYSDGVGSAVVADSVVVVEVADADRVLDFAASAETRAREDECLILASDGLWDVMTNEEACEVARRRILLWHKKNGPITDSDRGQGVDPVAQAAGEYLSMFALQKGSKDNISVIVVDLKAQRKFKNKS